MLEQSIIDTLSAFSTHLAIVALIPMLLMMFKLIFELFGSNAKASVYVPVERVCAYCGTKNSLDAKKKCKCCLAQN